jgi:integrase
VLDAVLDSPAGAATGAAMANGYKTTCEGRAGASCRLILSCLRTFGQFLVDEKLAKENPAGGIKPRGVAKKGKAQIETRRELLAFQAETFRRAGEGDRASLGVLLGLHLGMRSAEVRALEPRHIDLDRTIRVPGTKTTAAVRSLRIVSDELWTLVDQAARAGGHLVPFWGSTLIIRVRQLAQAAGVSNHMALTFHSLRGMAASLATEGGAAESAIAAALGHKSYAVTAEHYATPASQEAAAGQRRFQVLKGGR